MRHNEITVPENLAKRAHNLADKADQRFGIDNYTIQLNLFTDGDHRIKAEHNLTSDVKMILWENKDEITVQGLPRKTLAKELDTVKK